MAAAGLDWRSVATIVAVAAGEAAYWLVRAPTEVAKTQAQVSAIDPTLREGNDSSDHAGMETPPEKNPSPLSAFFNVFEAYPILALTDLPVVVLRVYFFLVLKASGAGALLAVDSSLTSDLVLYIVASLVSNGLATPLEVVRTRLLLQRSGESAGTARYTGIVDALATIYEEEGLEALFRGLQVRLLWNGLWLGVILGLQRAACFDIQTFFLGVVEDIEDVVGSEWEEWLQYLTPSIMPSPGQLDSSAMLMKQSSAALFTGDQLVDQLTSIVENAT